MTTDSTSQRPGGTWSSWSLRSWLRVVGAICLSGAVVAIVVGGLAISQLTTARLTLVDRIDPALLSSLALSTALLNQETGIRGFVATGNQEFLTPYQQGRQQEGSLVATLRRLGATESRPELTTDLDAIVTAANAWRTDYAEPKIAAVTASGPGSGNGDPVLGKVRFDAVRAELERQRTGLTEARAAARASLDSAANTLLMACLSIGVALLALLSLTGIWVRRTITSPVERLSNEVRTVAAGQFGRQVTGRGPRELVELATDIDSMRRQILAELTNVQALNQRLDAQTAELRRSNSDLEQFAYVASHDLQEPLRKVSGFCELLAKRYGGQLDDRADQYIHFAVDGARRMSVLINDLLAFSRIGRTASGSWSQVGCSSLLAQALRNLGEVITQTGATITHDPLPTVVGEASLLTTVFQNLVGNAIKFRGEQPPQVHIAVALESDVWSFRVSDNGIGIDPAYAEKIFVIFQRLHSKDAYPGTGIGLALCRKIIDYHHGRIWFDSANTSGANTSGATTPGATTPGAAASGSAFCFTLPAIADNTEEATTMTAPVMTATSDD